MKIIGSVIIEELIEAHYKKDERKFRAYAEFIAEAYKERGEKIAEKIIRSQINGTYKEKPKVIIQEQE